MRNRRRASFLVVLGSILVGALMLVSPAVGAPGSLETDLNGYEEVPPADLDGTGNVTLYLVPELGRICFVLNVGNIAPAAAAHIHKAPFGVNGGIVVFLTAPTRGASGGCVSGLSHSLVQDILDNPEDYYVNVHNADFPGGAIRGQLGD